MYVCGVYGWIFIYFEGLDIYGIYSWGMLREAFQSNEMRAIKIDSIIYIVWHNWNIISVLMDLEFILWGGGNREFVRLEVYGIFLGEYWRIWLVIINVVNFCLRSEIRFFFAFTVQNFELNFEKFPKFINTKKF